MISYNIIAAVSDNLAIGKGNKMPWHLPEDLSLFKRLTIGNIIIMGRKTYESIGKPLPGRETYVVTGSPEAFLSDKPYENLSAFNSLQTAIDQAEKQRTAVPKGIFIAGGASIYAQALDGASRLYLSRVNGEFEADTFFPEFRTENWQLESTEQFETFRLEIWENTRR